MTEGKLDNVVVTGGAGFIGFHLSKYLLKKHCNVLILDNFSDYYSVKIKRRNAKELEEKGAKIIEGSILDEQILTNVFNQEIDCVFHFAAQPGVRYSSLNPERSLRSNIEGTSLVLSNCQKNNIKKIVIASSSSVFGREGYLPIDEKHSKNPVSYYGVSKLATEHLVEVYRHLNVDADISIIRPFTVIGPRQRPDMAINLFVTNALEERKLTIYGDGLQSRDWTHVDNIVEATYLMAVKSLAKNEDFNIGSGIRTTVKQVLELISNITNKDLNIEYRQFDKADVKDTLANINKAKKLLGYQPKKSIDIAIREFIEDYKIISSLD